MWTNPEGGFWRAVANWRDGVLPGPDDVASIQLNDGATVQINFGDVNLRGLRLSGDLALTSPRSTVQVNDFLGSGGSFRHLSGTLQNTRISGGDDFKVEVTGSPTWSNTVLAADALVSSSRLFVVDGLTVDGVLQVDDNGVASRVGEILLQGPQTINGTGKIVLDGGIFRYERTGSFSVDDPIIPIVLGADLTLQGNGSLQTSLAPYQILGRVMAMAAHSY